MRPGSAPALAHVSNSIAAAHRLPHRDHVPRHMPVQRRNPVAMVDHHGPAITIHLFGIADNTCRWRNDPGAYIGLNVHAAMERSFAAKGIAACAKRAVD